MANSTHLFNIIFRVVDKASASLVSIDRSLKNISNGFERNNKAIGGMNKQMLGLGLGMTFFMFGVQMQLQRMLRSMFNIFQQAEGETGVLNQQFNIVRANLAAVSIAFFDAFAQSGLFDMILIFVTTIADWYLNLTDSQREWVTTGTLGIFTLIKTVSFLGQILLAVYLAIQLHIAIWGPWALIAIAAIVIVIKAWKAFKSVFKDTTDDLGKTNEKFWIDWRLKALDSILIVINAIPQWLRKLQGITDHPSVIEGLIAQGRSKLAEINAERIATETSASARALRQGGYVPGLGYITPGAQNVYPTSNPDFVPGQTGGNDYDLNELIDLQREQVKIAREQSINLGKLKIIFDKASVVA